MKKIQKMIMMAAVCTAVGMMGACAQAQEETKIQTQEASAQAENREDGAAERKEQQTEGDAGQVASPDEMATPEDVVEDWMVPIYADELNDGTYDIEVASSSSMFRVVSCQLTVENGEMSAVMTMGGTGYLKVYMGTGEEAAEASEDEMIPFVENEDGAHTFEVPVEALDMGIDCAAFSKNKEKWYDRVLVFQSASLPAGARKEVEMTTVEDLGLEDGEYMVEAELEGGSGRTEIGSPARITVENGQAVAEIIFGSPYYDYVMVGDEKYEPVNTEGNSTFLIPVEGFDYYMPITADTIAMSVPHEIDYRICFDSATLQKAQ